MTCSGSMYAFAMSRPWSLDILPSPCHFRPCRTNSPRASNFGSARLTVFMSTSHAAAMVFFDIAPRPGCHPRGDSPSPAHILLATKHKIFAWLGVKPSTARAHFTKRHLSDTFMRVPSHVGTESSCVGGRVVGSERTANPGAPSTASRRGALISGVNSRCQLFALPNVNFRSAPPNRPRTEPDRFRESSGTLHLVNRAFLETDAAGNFMQIDELDRGGIRHRSFLGQAMGILAFSRLVLGSGLSTTPESL